MDNIATYVLSYAQVLLTVPKIHLVFHGLPSMTALAMCLTDRQAAYP